jgi:hypothetical protein
MDKSEIKSILNNSEKAELKAPLHNLEEWRQLFMPKDVWENEYLQAYLKSKRILQRCAMACIVFLSFWAGTHVRL